MAGINAATQAWMLIIFSAGLMAAGCGKTEETPRTSAAEERPAATEAAQASAAATSSTLNLKPIEITEEFMAEYDRAHGIDRAADPWGMGLAEVKYKANPPAAERNAPPKAGDPRVKLTWRTESEDHAFGFFIYRADTADGQNRRRLNPGRPLLAERGKTDAAHRYVYYDLDVEAGKTYYYRVFCNDMAGKGNWAIGKEKAVEGTAKPLTEAEAEEIAKNGAEYREKAEE